MEGGGQEERMSGGNGPFCIFVYTNTYVALIHTYNVCDMCNAYIDLTAPCSSARMCYTRSHYMLICLYISRNGPMAKAMGKHGLLTNALEMKNTLGVDWDRRQTVIYATNGWMKKKIRGKTHGPYGAGRAGGEEGGEIAFEMDKEKS